MLQLIRELERRAGRRITPGLLVRAIGMGLLRLIATVVLFVLTVTLWRESAAVSALLVCTVIAVVWLPRFILPEISTRIKVVLSVICIVAAILLLPETFRTRQQTGGELREGSPASRARA